MTLTNVQLNRLSHVCSVTDFGAQGDGTTDDTVAIQAAITTGKNVAFPPGKYKVTSTLTIPSGNTGQIIYSLNGYTSYPTSRLGGNAEIYFDKADITTEYANEPWKDAIPCFLVNAPGVSFQGLWIHGNVNTRNQIAVKTTVTTDNLADDADTKIDNCQFNDWKYVIYHIGRGAEVTGCLINTCTTGVLLDWPSSGVGPNDGTVPISVDDDYANRGTRIQDNRFHGVTTAVQHIGSFPLVGALITGNHLDIGTGLFAVGTNVNGYGGQETRDTLISNNVVTFSGTSSNIIQYWRETKSIRDHITNNHFVGGINDEAGTRTPYNLIYFRSCHTITDLTISNNYLAYVQRHGILFANEDSESAAVVDGVNIHNNTFAAWGFAASDRLTRGGISIEINTTNLSIRNNIFKNTYSTNECIRFNGTTQTNLNLHNNTIHRISGDNSVNKLTGSGGGGGTVLNEVATPLTIASGYICIKGNYHELVSQSGTTDDLATIYGGYLGQILVLRATSTDTITVHDNDGESHGKIQLSTAEFPMSGNDKLILIYSGTEWHELSRSDN